MRIEPNNIPTELSYMELLSGIKKDLESDAMIPAEIKRDAEAHVDALRSALAAYSA